MSVKSTYSIDRETAIKVVLSKIYELSDEQLANILEELPGSEFRNYWIGWSGGDDRCINTVDEFGWK